MTGRPWYESYFGEDYLEIHRDDLGEERSRRQVEGMVSLLDLEPQAWYGGLDGRPLELTSWRLVVIGERKAAKA